MAHDSAFKDKVLQLQNVRVRFIPTEKKDVRDLGPMEEVMLENCVLMFFVNSAVYFVLNQFASESGSILFGEA